MMGDHTSLSQPIFIPPREVLSLFPGFVSLYDKRELSFDCTYRDLCAALDTPLLRNLDLKRTALLAPIEKVLRGRVILDGGRFYIDLPGGKMEAPLLAAGLRKLAMLTQLIRNGSLSRGRFCSGTSRRRT